MTLPHSTQKILANLTIPLMIHVRIARNLCTCMVLILVYFVCSILMQKLKQQNANHIQNTKIYSKGLLVIYTKNFRYTVAKSLNLIIYSQISWIYGIYNFEIVFTCM